MSALWENVSRVSDRISWGQVSQRVKGLGVMLYVLGLSYGAVTLALEALGIYLAKSSVYEAILAAAEQVPGLKRMLKPSSPMVSILLSGGPGTVCLHLNVWDVKLRLKN